MWQVSSLSIFQRFLQSYLTRNWKKKPDSLVLSKSPSFVKKGNCKYTYLVRVLGQEETYVMKEHSDSKIKYSDQDIF